ncbi:UNVERIFIED_CONTAM: hypothetical protein Scaly_2984400 [Sesamum calycinum]|uniref:Uncharacterized protein n=1 Tax=Sesamum calycinum TaxID=2727403 RepID=A0AAW2KLU5_9LAMI
MTRKPFIGQSTLVNGLLDLIHTDVCGPLNTEARGRLSYLITFTDDHSRVLEKRFFSTYQRDELLLEELSEAHQSNTGTSSTFTISTDNVPVLRRSARVPQPPERYRFLGVIGQLDIDLKTFGEAMLNIDSEKWLEAMKSEMDSMSSLEPSLDISGPTQQC